jgi:hypothetical protein
VANPNWVKGVSANPGGRPKERPEVRMLARKRTEEAVETLAAICSDPEAPHAARVAAAVALLDRGWGKPTQPIDANVNVLDKLSDAAQLAVLSALDALESGEGGVAERVEATH